MICTLANSLWLAGCVSESTRFRQATRGVPKTQEKILSRILNANAGTEFGATHDFQSIRTIAEYQKKVPIRDYDQHEPWIARAAAGLPNILTREAVRLFEPTSGSSAATKLIPYTPSLQREFQKGAAVGHEGLPAILQVSHLFLFPPSIGQKWAHGFPCRSPVAIGYE